MQADSIVLDIHFPEARLNDLAGDPYWIDLTVDEASQLCEALKHRFEPSNADASGAASAKCAILVLE